jgi:molecular chaperone DnaK
LNVSAKDKATGKEQSIVIKASSGLSDEEIEKMVKDAEANAEADRKFESLIGARNMADSMMHATKKSMAEAGDKLTDDEKQPVLDAIAALESVLGSDDQEEIEAKTKALTDASAKIAEKLYASADAGAQATDAGGQSQSADDDVVDAEFEEVKDDEKKS